MDVFKRGEFAAWNEYMKTLSEVGNGSGNNLEVKGEVVDTFVLCQLIQKENNSQYFFKIEIESVFWASTSLNGSKILFKRQSESYLEICVAKNKISLVSREEQSYKKTKIKI